MKPKLEAYGLRGEVIGAKTVEVIAVAHKDGDMVSVSLWASDGTRLGQTLQVRQFEPEARRIMESLGWEP